MIGAFLIGFVGSLHCIGMCGPLNMMMIGKKGMPIGFALYHSGRIFSYALLGLVIGFIGHSASFFHVQQFLTIGLGIALLFLYGIPSFRIKIEKAYYQSGFSRFIRKSLASHFSTKNRWVLSGVANGFLPCGLSYVAAAGAMASSSFTSSILFMVLFGLGTLPALAVLSLGGQFITDRFRSIIPRSISFLAILSGSILILRGLLITSPDFNQLVQKNMAGLITVCGL